jgi:hypothetical protein
VSRPPRWTRVAGWVALALLASPVLGALGALAAEALGRGWWAWGLAP